MPDLGECQWDVNNLWQDRVEVTAGDGLVHTIRDEVHHESASEQFPKRPRKVRRKTVLLKFYAVVFACGSTWKQKPIKSCFKSLSRPFENCASSSFRFRFESFLVSVFSCDGSIVLCSIRQTLIWYGTIWRIASTYYLQLKPEGGRLLFQGLDRRSSDVSTFSRFHW